MGYRGVEKLQEMQGSNAKIKWHAAIRAGKRKTFDAKQELHKLLEKVERLKASLQAKAEPSFRVIKQQFGLRQGTLPWAPEEHGAPDDVVCSWQPVDGREADHGAAGIGASV